MLDHFPEMDHRVELGNPTETTKYVVGKVALTDGSVAFRKTVKDPGNLSAVRDLGNEATWLEYMTANPLPSFDVPAIYQTDSEGRGLLLEWVDGKQISESSLPDAVVVLSDVVADMITTEGVWQPMDMGQKYRGRLEQLDHVFDSGLFGAGVRYDLDTALANQNARIASLVPGLAHGDFNLPNIIRKTDGRLVLPDGEFSGTPLSEVGQYKPRLHDAAHFYHMLRCQYQHVDIADEFYELLEQRLMVEFQDDISSLREEFHLTVLERTISMMNHFITNRPKDKIVTDARRLDPIPYVHLVHESLDRLK